MVTRSTVVLLLALAASAGLYLWWQNQSDDDQADAEDGVAGAGGGALDFIDVQASRIVNTLTSRGYRNNNPGNLRFIASNPWNGQTGNDGGYGIYDSPQNGTRALGHQLSAYGLDTVAGIITRWAPSTENNTSAYITDVSDQLGVGPNDSIDVQASLADLAQAIARHENGYVDASYDWTWVYLP